MAVTLKKTTDSKANLKIISVIDTAIDWDASYPDPLDLEEETQQNDSDIPNVVESVTNLSLEERKKDNYRKYHDESKLRFKADDLPTLFVFAHPHRADVARKMREIASNIYTDTQRGKKDKSEKDMFTSVFHHFYKGYEQGFSGAELVVPQKINNRLTDDAIQELEDAEVFIELNSAFMNIYNQDRSKLKDKERKEK